MKETLTQISGRLKTYLELKKIGVNQLGRLSGTSGAQVSKILNGKSYNINTLLTIASVCKDLDVHWLLKGEGQMLLAKSPAESDPGRRDQIQQLQDQVSQLTTENTILKERMQMEKEKFEDKVTMLKITSDTYKDAYSTLSLTLAQYRGLVQDLMKEKKQKKLADEAGSPLKKQSTA
jgi:transcriptional regulator with XRE-family HTH domain